jgi:hypothetical protein
VDNIQIKYVPRSDGNFLPKWVVENVCVVTFWGKRNGTMKFQAWLTQAAKDQLDKVGISNSWYGIDRNKLERLGGVTAALVVSLSESNTQITIYPEGKNPNPEIIGEKICRMLAESCLNEIERTKEREARYETEEYPSDYDETDYYPWI